MHTNHTTNYELSQFLQNDKPTFLGDYNGDMLKIDTAIAGVATTAQGAVSTANAASATAGDAATAAASAASTAATADANASSALATAGNAATAAAAAQSTAESASAAAGNAQSTATGAVDVANAAQAAANGAVTALKTSLKQTLTAGQTTVAFTNAAITATARADLYVKDHTTGAALLLYPTAVSESAGSITFTFEAQASDVDVALWIVEEATA